MKKTIKVPEYFKDLPDDARLNAKEVAEIFGYKSPVNMKDQIKPGFVPMYDNAQSYRTVKGGIYSRYFWKVKTIREWIENVNRLIPK